jgi:translocation and assembly module TamB
MGSGDSASIGEACLGRSDGDGRACIQGAWSATGGSGGEVRLETLPLSLLAASAPDGISVDGFLEGQATFALGADGSLAGDGLFTTEGQIDATTGEQTVSFRLEGDGVQFAVDESGASAALDLGLVPDRGSGDVRASGEVRLPGLNQLPVVPEEQPLEGSLTAVSDDLSFLAAFVPPVARAQGSLDLEANLAGTLAEPEILGGLVLADGELDVPEAGLELRGLTVEAQGEPGGAIGLDARVESGDGFMEVTGQLSALPSPETPAELQVSGDAFRAVDTPEIQVEIATDLQVSFDGELTTVRGQLDVPWARIELVELPESSVPPSPDVVFVGEEPAPLPLVDARVQVHVGDDVFFSGMGFTSDIVGDIVVTQAPGRDPLTQGEINFIDGRFAAYGQNLDIEPGRVTLAGSPLDATLDVTAERLAQDGTTAGVRVTGPALDPTINLVSDPAQTDADALSYIMYGRPLNDGNASQQQTVVGAAANLGANVLTTQLAGSVGLDEARIEGTTRDTAELVAGKYLSPSVFVAYGRGLFKPTNTFRLKYLLSSSWALQAESGEANGGDVLYQIERGN